MVRWREKERDINYLSLMPYETRPKILTLLDCSVLAIVAVAIRYIIDAIMCWIVKWGRAKNCMYLYIFHTDSELDQG